MSTYRFLFFVNVHFIDDATNSEDSEDFEYIEQSDDLGREDILYWETTKQIHRKLSKYVMLSYHFLVEYLLTIRIIVSGFELEEDI